MVRGILTGLAILIFSMRAYASALPSAELRDFGQQLLELVKASPAEFNRQFPGITQKIAQESLDADTLPLFYMLKQTTWGTFIDQALSGRIVSVQYEEAHFSIQLRMLAAALYETRSHKDNARHPHALLRQQISLALREEVSHTDLKRFIAAGAYDIRTIVADEKNPSETIYEYLKARVAKQGRAALVFAYFHTSSEGDEDSPLVNNTDLIMYLKKACASKEAYVDFINYYESAHFDVDSIEYAPGQMVGPLLDRSSELGDTKIRDILVVVKARRSKFEHTVIDKFRSSPEDVSPRDNLCRLVMNVLSANKATLFAHYEKLQQFYGLCSFDVDTLIYSICKNGSSENVIESSLGSIIQPHTSMNHALVSALVYEGRSKKPSTSPQYLLIDYLTAAMLGGDAEFDTWNLYFKAGSYDIDTIAVPRELSRWGTTIEDILYKGYTYCPFQVSKLLHAVQHKRSHNFNTLRWLCEKTFQKDVHASMFLERWLTDFPVHLSQVGILTDRPTVSLGDYLDEQKNVLSKEVIQRICPEVKPAESELTFEEVPAASSVGVLEGTSTEEAPDNELNQAVASLTVSSSQLMASSPEYSRALSLRKLLGMTLICYVTGILYQKMCMPYESPDAPIASLASQQQPIV